MLLDKYPALKYRDFNLWGIGQFISNVGTQMQFVAVNWEIYLLTHSPFALGLVGLTRVIPIVIFSLIAGVVTDSFNRKIANLVTLVAGGVFSTILALLTLNHAITPLYIYILSFLTAAAFSFEVPTRQALVYGIVDKKDLPNALSMVNIIKETSTILGPAFAGFLIVWIGVGNIYILNALSFGVIVLSMVMMHASGEVVGKTAELSLNSIKEGFSFIFSKSIIWSTIILDFLSTFFSGATALLPIFAKDILNVGPQGLGFLYAAPSIGAVVMAFVLSHVGALYKKKGKVLIFAIVSYAVGTIVFGFSRLFIISLGALFILGAGDAISTIIRSIIRQSVTPDHLRGRMTSIVMLFALSGPQLGDFEAGALAALIGAPLSVVSGGIGTLVVVGIVVFLVPAILKFDKPS